MSQAEMKRRYQGVKPPTEHVGHTISKDAEGEKDLSGQLSQVKVGHPRHAGTSRPETEKMIASERDSSPALNEALPPNNEALAAPKRAGKLAEKHEDCAM